MSILVASDEGTTSFTVNSFGSNPNSGEVTIWTAPTLPNHSIKVRFVLESVIQTSGDVDRSANMTLTPVWADLVGTEIEVGSGHDFKLKWALDGDYTDTVVTVRWFYIAKAAA